MAKQVKIMRGCSGSGKSTYQKKHFPKAYVCSADDYWLDENGNYKFDVSKHGESHAWCLRKFIDMIVAINHDEVDFEFDPDEEHLIVVDNTNTTVAELAPYAAIGTAYGWDVEIVTIDVDTDTAHPRNVHNVPQKTVHGQRRNLVANTSMIPKWWKHKIVKES